MPRSLPPILPPALLLTILAAPAVAQQPPVPTPKKVITYDHLRDLSSLSNRVYDFRYNVYQFEEAWRTVDQYAALLLNTQLVWRAVVLRVTATEVIYSFEPADRTSIAVIPGPDAQAPDSRHARHRTYPGPPSNRYFNLLSAPKTLRIGSAISLERAKQLQRGDFIQLVGDVETIETMRESGVYGNNLVYVSNARYDTYSQALVGGP